MCCRGNFVPFSKPSHTLSEIASRLEFRICQCLDRDVGQCMAEKGPQVFGKIAKGVIAALWWAKLASHQSECLGGKLGH